MMANRRKSKKVERLNLIPILDAIFIFIFFLLMSAQFIDIYEIGSDAPVTSKIDKKEEDRKKPLNLTLVISDNKIRVKTGLSLRTVKTIKTVNGEFDIEELKKFLVQLKLKHSKEKTVILKPTRKVKYHKLVAVMDAVKDYKNEQGVRSDLFKKIVFETM
jgi:biopolymer transport protein ExbD